MYIAFILQYQKVQKNCQILLIRAETDIALIVFMYVLYRGCAYTVSVSYCRST
jgi:hypothetical protein